MKLVELANFAASLEIQNDVFISSSRREQLASPPFPSHMGGALLCGVYYFANWITGSV